MPVIRPTTQHERGYWNCGYLGWSFWRGATYFVYTIPLTRIVVDHVDSESWRRANDRFV